MYFYINSVPNKNILDCSKLKAFADDKINITSKQNFCFEWVENTLGKGENAGFQYFLMVGKGENAGFQYFLLFQQCFQRLLLQGR